MATPAVTTFTAQEVADSLRCNKETVYRWARKGLIGDGPLAGRRMYRFTQQHIDDFLSGATRASASATKESKPKRDPKYSR